MTFSSSSSSSVRSPLLQPFYPALDGLRAVAFLMVFMVHYGTAALGPGPWAWGWVGVDLFFVLSGFLITGILFDTLHRPDFFRRFYTRRSLRIFPLYYSFWVLLLLLTPVLHLGWDHREAVLLVYAGNLMPWFIHQQQHLNGLLPFAQRQHHVEVMHFWSLCVEEQFYLVWPAVVYFVRSRRKLLAICLAWMAAAPLGRSLFIVFHPQTYQDILYGHTLSRADTLLAGAALALFLRGAAPSPRTLRRLGWLLLLGAPCLVMLGHHLETPALQTNKSGDPFVSSFGFSLIALAGVGAMLLAIDPKSLLVRVLQLPPLLWLGRISYGLYLIHMLPAWYFVVLANRLKVEHRGYLGLLIPFAFSVVAATLSYHFLEKPFLRLKDRWGAAPHKPLRLPAPSDAVGLAEAPPHLAAD